MSRLHGESLRDKMTSLIYLHTAFDSFVCPSSFIMSLSDLETPIAEQNKAIRKLPPGLTPELTGTMPDVASKILFGGQGGSFRKRSGSRERVPTSLLALLSMRTVLLQRFLRLCPTHGSYAAGRYWYDPSTSKLSERLYRLIKSDRDVFVITG